MKKIAPLCFLLFVPTLLLADWQQSHGPLKIKIFCPQIKENSISLADVLTVTVEIKTTDKVEIVLSPPQSTLTWHVSDNMPKSQTIELLPETTFTFRYRVDAMVPGSTKLPLPKIKFRVKQKEAMNMEWQPIDLIVSTPQLKPDLALIAPVGDIEELPVSDHMVFPWALVISCGLLFFCLLIVLAIWLRRFRGQPQNQPIFEKNATELKRLSEANMPTQEWASRVNQLIREYFQLEWRVDCESETTDELFELLRTKTDLPQEAIDVLQKILTQCDVARFSPVGLSGDQQKEMTLEAMAGMTALHKIKSEQEALLKTGGGAK